ncbi:hypothetical protein Unana1_03580 [Umbelopsis nana]
MNDQLKSVCEDLDNLAIEYITEADSIAKLKQNVGNVMTKGFFDLSQAKYIMGTNKLSRYSYDERMKSLYKIDITTEKKDDNNIFAINKVEFKEEADEEKRENAEENVSEQLNNLSLRKRIGAQESHDGGAIPEMENKDDGRDHKSDANSKSGKADKPVTNKAHEKRPVNRNPLYWFGVLVPPSLRTSQQHFKTVVSYAVEEANLLHKLSALEAQYQALQNRKQQILSDMVSSPKASSYIESDNEDKIPDSSIDESVGDQVVPELK